MVANPFITYGYESPEYFCDREEETRTLTTLLTNGNNVALISPRRMGKTGLLQHCFNNEGIRNQYHTFIIDIYATKSLKDMVYQMGHSIVKRLKPRGQAALDRFLEIVTSLRTGISFDGQGNASWNVDIGSIKSPEFTLDEIFAYLQSADRPCIVAIDEFQSISLYPEKNIEAQIRTYVQQCRNAVFVFSGSQRSMMSEMFASPARPFYQSVSLMFLRPISLDKYILFAQKHFNDGNKQIEAGVVEDIYKKFDGTTWYIQKILNQLYAVTLTGRCVTPHDTENAIRQITEQNEEAYKDLLFQLSIKQKELFVAISKEGKARQITGNRFIKEYNLSSASSVQKAAAVLIDKQLITQERGEYEIYDKFMALWLRNN